MTGSDQLLEKILVALSALEEIQGRFDPINLAEYQNRLLGLGDVSDLVHTLAGAEINPAQQLPRQQLVTAGSQLKKGIELFCSAGPGQAELMKVFRAIRFFCRTQEALYPLAPFYSNVQLFFLENHRHHDLRFQKKISQAQLNHPDRGIIHRQNGRGQRGGYSLYIPECYDETIQYPLLIALHGGSGHGADFFYSWLREARSREFMLLAMTSKLSTWSLTSPEVDGEAIIEVINHLQEEYNLDQQHILLTGLSDGGTFAMRAGLLAEMPNTHLAPVASAAHALLSTASQYHGRKIYLVHGAKDWMFNVSGVRPAVIALKQAGAQVVYHEIDDLSHNYPRDENPAILEWWLG